MAWKTGQSPAIMVDRDSGVEVKPEVVDAHTGTPLDVRRVRVVARAPAAAARS